MKIIDIGICTSNNDPKGLGRIRYIPYGAYKSEIERSIDYEEWGENDLFIAIPFLPPNVNVIPKEKQSVKLIKYDTDKDTQNVEYVTGPFATPHDFGTETFTSQHKHTTYGGVIVKDLPDVMDKNGKYIDKRSEGTLSREKDQAIYGNYGSDIIFTENGMIIRGGKLIDKSTKNKKLGQRLREVPIISEKMSKITLKKFGETVTLVPEDVKETKISVDKVRHIVEYSVDSITSPTLLSIYVYKVIGDTGSDFDTNIFTETTPYDLTNTKLFKLISTGATPTITYSITSLSEASSELREFLHIVDQHNLTEINPQYPKLDIHPFFFKPTSSFSRSITENNSANAMAFISSIKVRNVGNGTGLIFSRSSANAPIIETIVSSLKLKTDNSKGEQSFASISSDLLYLLSTDVNKGPKKSINFKELDSYEFTQDDFLNKINPNTYSTVRGDVLIDLLKLIYIFLVGHVHNINDPAIHLEEIESKLEEMINKMSTDLVNQSIRIN